MGIAIWSIPPTFTGLGNPTFIDDSWKLGRILIHTEGHPFPNEITWTTGPLGFLADKLPIDYTFWSYSVVYSLTANILAFFVIAIFFIKNKISNWYIVPLAILSFLVHAFHFPLIGLLISYYLYTKYDKRKLPLIVLGFASSFFLFIKFDMAVMAFSFLLFSSLALSYMKRWKDVLLLISSYLVFSLMIWIFVGGQVEQLAMYLQNGFEVSSGYTAAMSKNVFENISTPISILSWLILFVILYSSKSHKTDRKLILLSIIPLFIFFKLGIVRNDFSHVFHFFYFWAFIIYLNGLTIKRSTILKIVAFSLVIILVISGFSIQTTRSPQILDYLSNVFFQSSVLYWEKLFVLQNPDSFDNFKRATKENLKTKLSISNSTLLLLEGKTIETFPWGVTYLYAHNLEWNSWAISQPFSSYTSKLDVLNSKHIIDNKTSPDVVFLRDQTIDKRFPFFDEPSTLRAIFCNYEPIAIDGNFLILQKGINNCSPLKLLTRISATFNERVEVPKHNGDYLYAKIQINYNSLGKLSSVFYKPPEVKVILNDEDRHRFIPDPAKNGILLSTSEAVKDVFPILNYEIKSLKFVTDESFYDESIQIEFFESSAKFDESDKSKILKTDPFDILLNVYEKRRDLQKAFPNVRNGDLIEYITWAKNRGSDEMWQLNYVKPWIDLLYVYYSSSDLQKKFPEVKSNHDIKNFVQWTIENDIDEESVVKSHEEYYRRYLLRER